MFNSSLIFLHMVSFAKLTVHRPVSQKSLFLSFYGVLSLPKELQGDCKALGDHKTVKQAPLKTKRRREQGFDVHQNAGLMKVKLQGHSFCGR